MAVNENPASRAGNENPASRAGNENPASRAGNENPASRAGNENPASRDRAMVEPLACGRDAAVVWDRAEAGTLDTHERGCPHCTAAVADALGLDAVVHRMAAQRLDPPATVLDQVLGAVRAELRSHDVLALASPHGPAGIDRAAAAAVLRHVVDGMDGVRARSCRIEQAPMPAGAAPAPVEVTISVTARFGVDLASVTARVRQMVRAAAEQAIGAPVRRIDIEVVDVFEGESR